MFDLKKIIKVKNTQKDLIRLGNDSDGGYVVNLSALEQSRKLYTYGVGSHWEFEKDYIKMYSDKFVEMYDHTVDIKDTSHQSITHHKKALLPTENCTTFDEVRNSEQKVFLKIDIEGAEYPFFEKADLHNYENVVGIVCEFHGLTDAARLQRFKQVIVKLQDYYDITHIHANNYATLIIENDFKFPQTPEISFLHKNLSDPNGAWITIDYPIPGLDFPNCKRKEDLKFSVFA
jgi:hypothetical protein